jgi:hypothetical protein
MPWVTGVELGPESCVLARVRPRQRVQLSAVRGLKDEDWDPARPLAENLADARRCGRFPRRARVVVWGLPGEASTADAVAVADVVPLREAGFTIDAVMSPAQALLVLSNRSPRSSNDEVVWLALNRERVAIAIIDSGRLLYSREFEWHYRAVTTVKQELLQRYSLVAHLAPEIRHGLDVVRAQDGVVPGAIVTCGNLPDLRSLTMPLIEELDIEVETLDTLEAVDLNGRVDREIVMERASTLYLALAAGTRESHEPAGTPARRWLAGAAAAVMVLAGGWLGLRTTGRRAPNPAGVAVPNPIVSQRPDPPAGPAPAPVTPAPPTPEASAPAATTGRREPQAHNPAARAPGKPRRAEPRGEDGQPLRDPLPVVNSIMVAPDRRLAVVAGEIVREGDTIGRRVLVRIERDSLVLREPSGHEVRVYIRRTVAPREGSGRP